VFFARSDADMPKFGWGPRPLNPKPQWKEDVMNLLLFLLIGLVAGWLAGQIMKGRGFGVVGNLIVGVVGAFIGGFVFDALNIASGGIVLSLAAALLGAIILLWIVGLVKKA
jgi:uncharacterized membrane protein YeaQ/YmgE (transglycosylase-associated protein family)